MWHNGGVRLVAIAFALLVVAAAPASAQVFKPRDAKTRVVSAPAAAKADKTATSDAAKTARAPAPPRRTAKARADRSDDDAPPPKKKKGKKKGDDHVVVEDDDE